MEASVIGFGQGSVHIAGRLEAGLRAIGYAPELIDPKVTIHAYGNAWIRGGLSEAAARSLAGVVSAKADVGVEHWTASLPRGRTVITFRGGLMEAGAPHSIPPPTLDGVDLDLDAIPERGIEWFPLAVEQAPSPSRLDTTLTKTAWQRYRLDLVLDRVLQQRGWPRPPRAVIRGWRKLPADGRPHWVALVRAATTRTARRLRDGRVQLELAWKERRSLAPIVALHDLDELLRWKDHLGLEGLD